jgi:hypothetical protein
MRTSLHSLELDESTHGMRVVEINVRVDADAGADVDVVSRADARRGG